MKRKRRLSAILIFIMILTSGLSIGYADTETASDSSTAGEEPAFTDIEGHWAESVITEASELKIVGGYPDGTFLPDNLIKREEFYKFLTNILTVTPDTSDTKLKFTDIVENEWYVPTIKIAAEAGITSGYGNGTFGIGLMISRQEAAKVAGSVISSDVDEDAEGADTVLDKDFIADWAYDYVDLMFKKGYMKGDTEGNFRPTMALTRAEAATILLNLKKKEDVIAANTAANPLAGCVEIHSDEKGVFTAGKGTEVSPYEVYTESQLNHMRMHATEGAFYILKKNIAITEDYATVSPEDMDAADWTEGNFEPIGNKETPFDGTLDGNGFTISGLNIMGTEGTGEDQTIADYAGLFGFLGEDSGVSDLTIDASAIEGGKYCGAVAGYSEGVIENCQLGSKGIVNGERNIGGLIGYSNHSVFALTNKGTVTGTKINTGGIVGYICAPGTALNDCQNEGSVSGSENTGGIAGNFEASPNAESIISECENAGTVQAGAYNAGGIAGYVLASYYGAVIEDCSNSGEVMGSGVNGGIAGLLYKGSGMITQCKNNGTVEGNGAGGIVGNNQGEITDCYNSGTVIADTNGGGIAAYQVGEEGTIAKCYNEGKVIANSYSGGIVGANESTVDYSYNCGKVRGSGIGGGIAGKNEGTIKYVYGAGVVTGESSTGSLIGRNAGTLGRSFWLNTTCSLAIGLEDPSSVKQSVVRVTQEELSGQQKIKTDDGYVMLLDLLNEKTEAWEYLYTILVPAPSDATTISDGGSVVTSIEVPSTDSTGNTVEQSDLTSKYLYPALIN